METLLESLLGNKIFEDEFDDVFQPMPMEEFVKNLTSQKGWSQNKDGSWDVEGDVSLSAMGLTKLPIRFGKIFRTFSCSHNSLTTLEGSPRRVGGGFYCNNNQSINKAFKKVKSELSTKPLLWIIEIRSN